VLIFALIFMISDRYLLVGDKKSHLKHVLRTYKVQISDF